MSAPSGTSTMSPSLELPLEKPGAGLPPAEAWLSRWVLLPFITGVLPSDRAITMLTRFGEKALSHLDRVGEKQSEQRVLIPRLRGMEDSSRYWSMLMTIEHLLITGEGMARMVESLARREPIQLVVRIEDVKPSLTPQRDDVMTAYRDFLASYPERMRPLLAFDLKATFMRHPHPWFGQMTAHEWLCLNALHHRIHEAQLRAIFRGLHA
jgi:hypothetical protein